MKYILKIVFAYSLIIISYNSFSQKIEKDTKETNNIKEIKSIFNDFINKKSNLPFFVNKDGNLILPPYFTNYKGFLDSIKYIGKIDSFSMVKSKSYNLKLNKTDINKLNNTISNDTNRLYIQERWFTTNKIKILPHSIVNKKDKSFTKYMKPIFFRNNTRCFFAIYYSSGMESFFLKKSNNHWIFDMYYLWVEED